MLGISTGVNARSLQSKALPKELPLLAVLGLSDPGDGDWPRLRGLQYASLGDAAMIRIATQAAGILAVMALLRGHVHIAVILGWITIVVATLWYGFRSQRWLADTDRRRMSRSEIQGQMISAALHGAAWAVPVTGFGLFVDPQTQVKIWTVLATLMTASAILLPAVPMTTLLFSGIALRLLHQGVIGSDVLARVTDSCRLRV